MNSVAESDGQLLCPLVRACHLPVVMVGTAVVLVELALCVGAAVVTVPFSVEDTPLLAFTSSGFG